MALFCRSALLTGTRSLAGRSKFISSKSPNSTPIPSPFSSPLSPQTIPRVSRVLTALGNVESLMPLHSAIASARLKSNIAVDSTCWSCLSQASAVPR